MHMQSRHRSNRRGLSCGRCCEVCVMQYWLDNQQRENRVHAYVQLTRRDGDSAIVFHCHHVDSQRARVVIVGNICTCKNGVAETGVGCPVDRTSKCMSCNTGWTINLARTACLCTCAYFRMYGQLPIACVCVTYCNCRFAVNVCTCNNGVAQTGVNCLTNGAAKCVSCNTGWTINQARTECIRTCAQ